VLTYEVLRSGMVGIARQSLALRLPGKICAFDANVARSYDKMFRRRLPVAKIS